MQIKSQRTTNSFYLFLFFFSYSILCVCVCVGLWPVSWVDPYDVISSYCRGNTQPHTQKEGGKGKEKRAPLACPLLPDIANKARRIRYHFFRSG